MASRLWRLVLFAVGAALLGISHSGCRRSQPKGGSPGAPPAPRAAAIPLAAPLNLDEPLPLSRPRVVAPTASGHDRFRVPLAAGQLLAVSLHQDGLDAKVVLFDPAGAVRRTVDSLNGGSGPELLYFVAGQAGEHWVEVEYELQGSASPGRYTLTAQLALPPSAAEREAARGSELLSDADALEHSASHQKRCSSLRPYEEARAAWLRAGVPEAEALTETRIGIVLAECGTAEAALPHFQRAVALRRQLGTDEGMPDLLLELGKALRTLGERAQARAAFESARDLARRLGERHRVAQALNFLALLARDAGEIWEALVLFESADHAFRELGTAARVDVASVQFNRGRLLMEVGQLEESKAAFQAALPVYLERADKAFAAYPAAELAWVERLQGDVEGARRDLARALVVARGAGDSSGEAVILDRMGTLAVTVGNPRAALPLYRQALAILRARGDRPNEAYTRSNLGDALALAGDPRGALRELDQALQTLSTLAVPASEAFAHFRLAKALRLLGLLQEARAESETTVGLLDLVRTDSQSAELRRGLVDWVHELYELRIDLLMELHARQPGGGFAAAALEAAEEGFARTLLDLVQTERQRSLGLAGQAVDRLRRVDEEIRNLEGQARGAPPLGPATEPEEGGANPLRLLLAERERLRVELRRATLERETPPHLVRLPEIQQRLLDPETTLLVYSLGERRSFVWAITRQGLRVEILPSRQLLEEGARRLHDLASRDAGAAQGGQQRLVAQELSNLLLQRIAPVLRTRRLAIVPDGALAYVPFQLLPEPGRGEEPLLAGHEVVVLPSASVLGALRQRAATRRPAPHQLAILAAPLFLPPGVEPAATGVAVEAQGHDPALALTLRETARATRDLGLGLLAPLPFSRREAEAILPLARAGQAFAAVGAEASLELATSGRLAQYRTVHLATHALIDPLHPELSGVVLSLYDAAGRPRPGFLLSYKILDLKLPAELVVLSACRTALGQELKGEGLVGLTQSFFHAGASRVLVSLWNVDDEATALLMTRFYEGLYRRRLPPAAALREAQLSLRSDPKWSAPFFWAGFQLQGDWRPFD